MRKFNFVLAVLVFAFIWGGLAVADQSGAKGPQGVATLKSWVRDHTETVWSNVSKLYRDSTGLEVWVADNDWSFKDTDLIELPLHDAIAACDSGELNLLPLHKFLPVNSPSVISNITNSVQPCSLGHSVWATIVAYKATNSTSLPPPKLIQDFFNTDAFPGKRAMKKSPRALAEWAMLNDGYPNNAVYTAMSSERAWEIIEKSLASISKDIIWVDSDEHALALVEHGIASFAVVSSQNLVRKIATQGETEAIGVIWDGALAHMNMLAIPKQAAAKEALQVLRFLTEPNRNLKASTRVGYAPVQLDQADFIAEKYRMALPVGAKTQNLVWANSKWWREHGTDIEAEFSSYVDQAPLPVDAVVINSAGL